MKTAKRIDSTGGIRAEEAQRRACGAALENGELVRVDGEVVNRKEGWRGRAAREWAAWWS
jgi:hypothetical protein